MTRYKEQQHKATGSKRLTSTSDAPEGRLTRASTQEKPRNYCPLVNTSRLFNHSHDVGNILFDKLADSVTDTNIMYDELNLGVQNNSIELVAALEQVQTNSSFLVSSKTGIVHLENPKDENGEWMPDVMKFVQPCHPLFTRTEVRHYHISTVHVVNCYEVLHTEMKCCELC